MPDPPSSALPESGDEERGDAPPSILVLGPVAVRSPQGGLRVLSGQQAEILSLLAARAPAAVSIDALVDTVWGVDAPKSASTGLRVVITRLRDKLEGVPGEAIVAEGGQYRLAVDPSIIDHHRFRSGVDRARRSVAAGEPAEAVSVLRRALALWRGHPFQPLSDSPALRGQSAQLVEIREEAEELLVDVLLADDAVEEAVLVATDLVAAAPYREHRWAQLMLGLYRSGRQVEALRTFQRASGRLAEDLGLAPGPALVELEAAVLAQDPALLGNTRPPSSSLPSVAVDDLVASLSTNMAIAPAPVTPLVGRDALLDEIDARLDRYRLVSLVGTAGVGKTKLATHVVQRRHDEQPLWVDLAIHEPSSLVGEIASQLGVHREDGVVDAIADALSASPRLLVLDNCEQLIGTAGSLAGALLKAANDLRVLVTSRIPLDIDAEAVVPVEPLAPDDARHLLQERAFGGHPSQALDRSAADALVHRLDGLPLAIELGAGLLRTKGADEILLDLDEGLDGLERSRRTDDRHRSLRAALEGSVRLLDGAERSAFCALATMRGPFTVGDLAAVLDADEATTGASLDTLTEHSLLEVSVDTNTGRSFRALETVRLHAQDHLRAEGRLAMMNERHAFAFRSLLEWAEPRWRGRDEERAVARIGAVSDQLRAAFQWSLSNDRLDDAATMAIASWDHAFLRLDRGQQVWALDVVDALARDADPSGDGQVGSGLHRMPELLGVAAMASWAGGDFDAARGFVDQALREAEHRGEPPPGSALRARLNAASAEVDVVAAQASVEALLDYSRSRADLWEHSAVLATIALGWAYLGAPGEGRAAVNKAITIAQEIENASSLAWATYCSGITSLDADPQDASRQFTESIRLSRSVRNRWVQGMATSGLVTAYRRVGDHERAAQLLAELIPHWERGGLNNMLGQSCHEAALVLDALGRSEDASSALLATNDVGHSQPLLPADQARLGELMANDKPGDVTLDRAGPDRAARTVRRLLEQALVG